MWANSHRTHCERDALPTELYPRNCGRHVNAAGALFKKGGLIIRSVGVSLLLHVVNLDEADTDSVILTADDCGVRTGFEVLEQDRGLAGVAWRQTSALDLCLLTRLPVVVRRNGVAVAVVQLDRRILHCLRDAEPGERWSDGAQDDPGKRSRRRTGKEATD